MGEVLKAVKNYFPQAAASIATTLKPTATAQLEADKAVSEPYAALAQQLFEKFGPKAAETSADIQDITDKAASARELDLAKTTGSELVTKADELQRKVDPEFYKNREQISKSLGEYLNASDPSLTENDAEEIRRASGRTLTNPDSAIDTAVKASRFGSRLDQKKSLFGEAINRVSAALPTIRSGIDAFGVATRRAAAPTGSERVSTGTTGAGENVYGLANNWINTAGSLQQQRMSQQKSALENATGWGKFAGNTIGSIASGVALGCWVAREVYGADNLKWEIFRNYVWTLAPAWFRELYLTYGEGFAEFIHNKPILKRIIRFFMDKTIRRNYAI